MLINHLLKKKTGYGPRSRLAFSGEEEEYDLWEVRFLGYMAIQDLKKTLLEADPDVSKNEKAYAVFVILLDEKSLALVMHDAANDGQKALKILREHYKASNSTSSDRVMKLKEFSSKKTTVKCYGCKQEGHYARKCPNLYCTNCKMKGHSLEKCPKKDNAKSCVQSASGDEPDHVSYAFRAGGTIHKDMGLLVDTGASSHIVRDPAMFSSFNDKFDTQRHSIELADGTQSKAAKERGTAHIAIMDANGRTHNATLNNALYVPDYPCDIFSVAVAVNSGATVSFGPDSAKMITQDGNKFNITKQGKLYYL